MLRDFYSDSYIEDNEIKHKVWDKSRIPTYGQFYYWFKKFEDPKRISSLEIAQRNLN